MITPKILTFFVTNQCNAMCSHCFNWKTKSTGELSLADIQKIDFSTFNSVSITGGEPTLRTDLVEICSHVAKNKIYLNTNGLMPHRIKEVIEKIGPKKVNITVSIDGTKEIHNQIRGIDCFNTAIETLKQCKTVGTEVTILTTISHFNMTNIPQLINYLKTEGLFTKKGNVVFNIARGLEHVFNLNPTLSFYHNPKDNNTILTLPELESIYTKIKPFMANQNRVVWEYSLQMLSKHKKLLPCHAGSIDMVLYANGDIAACEYTKSFANLKDYNFDLLALWNSNPAKTIKTKINNCYCIHPCNLNTAIPRTLRGFLKLVPDIAKNKTKQLKNKL